MKIGSRLLSFRLMGTFLASHFSVKEGSGIRILLGLMAREAKYFRDVSFFLVIVDRYRSRYRSSKKERY